jgi:putative hydrolase of the HAD superfamily
MTGPSSLDERIKALARPMEPIATGVEARLPHLGGIRGILFDVYGTLLVSGSGDVGTSMPEPRAEHAAAAFRAVGFDLADASAGVRGAQLLRQWIDASHEASRRRGVAWPEVDIREIWRGVLETLKREGLLQGEVARPAVDALAVEFEGRANPVGPMPGGGAVVRRLADGGLSLGIVSNAQFYTPIELEYIAGIRPGPPLFDAGLCVWSYETGEAKPSPALFARALKVAQERLGLRPDQVLAVGNDVNNDIAPAAALGARTCLFAGDARSLRMGAEEGATVPDAVVTDLRQILSVLEG